MIKAVLIGLGQVAWRFDEEPGRKAVWTHLGAYRACGGRITVAGAFDPSEEARQAFADRHPDVPVFGDIGEMMRRCTPDVVSICAPNDKHLDAIQACFAAHSPRAVWCEKPLATSEEDAAEIARLCEQSNALLIVSYVRNWHPLWRRFKARLDGGEIGRLESVRIAMPNRLWSIGSHAMSLLCWLGGEVSSMQAMNIPALEETGEPAVSGLFRFTSGATGILQVTGLKDNLLVEAEAIGTEGRLTCREGSGTISAERFEDSARYSGYRELSSPAVELVEASAAHSPFTAIATEIADALDGKADAPAYDPKDALMVQALLERLADAARIKAPSASESSEILRGIPAHG